MTKNDRQAVLLIHGMGEQRPMDSLRSFVDAVWTSDEAVQHEFAKPGVFSKPDLLSGNFELRRMTTTQNSNEVRTDFFEFYWAHLMSGNSLKHVWAWVKQLLLRKPWTVPRPLVGAWFLLVGILLFIALLNIQPKLPEAYRFIDLPSWTMAGLSFVFAVVLAPFLKLIIGDAARYLNAAPMNIKRRQEIRAKGVEILKKLHECGDYDRIIVVGHSLGSVIGYDLLTHAWPLFNHKADRDTSNPVMNDLEASVVKGDIEITKFQDKQSDLRKELNQRELPWLVSDFVTLGSPLTHGEILTAKNKADLESKQAEREYPTCPPVLESDLFSYPTNRKKRTPHHAAVFGPTRWTNLYFPARFLIWGDFISGPLQKAFGWGIRDRAVKTKIRFGFVSHTVYWKHKKGEEADDHILALRDAVNLLDKKHHPDETEA